jgi:shikimate kinase
MIKKRMFFTDLPGFLNVNNPEESFKQIFKKRSLIYEQIFDYKLIMEDQKKGSDIFSKLENLWLERGK